MSDIKTIRSEAKTRGLNWEAVQAAYVEVKQVERETRERPNEVRAAAWMMATASTPGAWPFWRHGFHARWGQKIARGEDYTVVPGYDEIAQQIGTAFPEYADDSQALFEFLFAPYDRLPGRDELYRKAMDLVERHVSNQETNTEVIPF